MIKQVWKYKLDNIHNEIEMPIGSVILTIQKQFYETFIWALVDPTQKNETRVFEIFGTGQDIDLSNTVMKYINTFQDLEGSIILHVFELINTKP